MAGHGQYKLIVFTISAAFAALAGAMKAIAFQNASLSDVHWMTSGEPILMTLVGGLGTFFGPLIGAVVITSLETYLSHLGGWVTVVEGLIFIFCVLAFRQGIAGTASRWLKRQL